MNCAKKISFYYKFGLILVIISCDILSILLLYLKWDQFIAYPLGSLIPILSIQLNAKIGTTLIIRQIVLMIFFCRMHCFLFNKCNEYFTHLSKNCRKKHLKTCLSFHYMLCESVEESQTFMRPMFVWITTIWCPMFCYLLYYSFNTKESDFMIISIVFTTFIFFSFILILLTMIAMIDIVAKDGIHSVYGCALKLANDKQASYPVSLNYLYCLNYFLT